MRYLKPRTPKMATPAKLRGVGRTPQPGKANVPLAPRPLTVGSRPALSRLEIMRILQEAKGK
jgi:hypothetical protein